LEVGDALSRLQELVHAGVGEDVDKGLVDVGIVALQVGGQEKGGLRTRA